MSEYPDDLREQVESYLEGIRFSQIPPTEGLEDAMRYSLLAGGKRIRPVLALATARSIGLDPERVLPAADPHLLPDPRRPARDGRRRASTRDADGTRQVR